MMTISAVAFLFSTKTLPLSLLINNYEGDFLLGEAAIISLVILFFNFVVKFVVYFLNKKDYERSEKHELDI
jgi:ABC-type Fe3+ transport system permease subunit